MVLTGCALNLQQALFESCGGTILVGTPEWSPDSTRLVYPAHISYSSDLYLFDLATGQTSQITTLPTDEYSPIWSADGTSILFLSIDNSPIRPRSSLMMSRLDGTGEITHLIDFKSTEARTFAWSPDSDLIVFPDTAHSDGADPDTLNLMNVQALSVTELASEYPYDSPEWSPDGTSIAFIAHRVGSLIHSLMVMSSNGDYLRTLHSVDSSSSISRPLWSPDSNRLLFVTEEFGTASLHLINADGSGLETLYAGNPISAALWLPDDKRVAYFASGVITTLYLDGSKEPTRLQTGYDDRSLIAFSPDGAWYAAVPVPEFELFMHSMDGSQSIQLRQNPANQRCLKWP
jgi:Tol biopolymer transport system component